VNNESEMVSKQVVLANYNHYPVMFLGRLMIARYPVRFEGDWAEVQTEHFPDAAHKTYPVSPTAIK
jgi:hypothetical protein